MQFECARVLPETLFVLVLMYGSETMLWKEKERSRIRDVQMDNLRGLLVNWSIDSPKCKGVMNGVVRKVDEGVLQWFSLVERMENDRIAKRVYVGVCAGSHSVVRLWKRWIDTMMDCLMKSGLDVWQARRMVGTCEGE